MHFNLALIQFFAEHRNPLLTEFFQFWTMLGDTNGYIVVVSAIYVLWDKRLALRLAAVVLVTSAVNHLLKLAIHNPRPFVENGTYLRYWAVSRSSAAALAKEYSTPSGHAMASAAFYTYLIKFTKDRTIQLISVAAVIFIGLSRPYLGVHYVEDILIGWTVGLMIALLAAKYTEEIAVFWTNTPYQHQIIGAILITSALFLASFALDHWRIDVQHRTLLEYAGFLTGVVVAEPLERRYVAFDPACSAWHAKALRYLISIVTVIITIAVLGKLSNAVVQPISQFGYLLDYIRYTTAGVVSIFIAPLIFTKVGLCAEIEAKSN